ncbi:unnamed protein product, partial [Mesorhabditis spiculigera]
MRALFCLLAIVLAADAYMLLLDADETRCFHQWGEPQQQMKVMWEVAEGGFRDIESSIKGPEGRNIYHSDLDKGLQMTFTVRKPGPHELCFINEFSTQTPKSIRFNFDILAAKPVHNATEDDAHVKLSDMIWQLSQTVVAVKHEQEYMEMRSRIHYDINENTNSRVVYWALFETVILVSMTLSQIWYLKRFFEVRRMV